MNNVILNYFRQMLESIDGNYFEFGADSGSMVSILGSEFASKTFISVDNNPANVDQILNNLLGRTNVLFYAMSAMEYNQSLTDPVAESYNVTIAFVNHCDYADSAESVKIVSRLIGTKVGYVVFSILDPAQKEVIDEFKQLLGYRIISEETISNDAVVYKLREQ